MEWCKYELRDPGLKIPYLFMKPISSSGGRKYNNNVLGAQRSVNIYLCICIPSEFMYIYVYHQHIQGITEKNAVWYVIRRCIPIAWVETVSKLYSKVGKWIPKVSWRSWEPTGSNKTAGRHTNEIHKTKNTKIQKSKNIYVKELLYMVKYLYLYFVF